MKCIKLNAFDNDLRVYLKNSDLSWTSDDVQEDLSKLGIVYSNPKNGKMIESPHIKYNKIKYYGWEDDGQMCFRIENKVIIKVLETACNLEE